MRLRSLDVFRGLTMAAMVIVNNPGDWATVYWPLLHAEWHGWTPTDLVFPFFLFIMGVAMAQAPPDRQRPLAIVGRGAILIGAGLFLAGFPWFNPARWRIPGVLQRIGLCYIVAAGLWRLVAVPGDRRATLTRVGGVAAAALLGYWALLALVAPPGGVAGDLTAEGNLGAWLDRAVFGTHTWKPQWDPEGLLSSLPAVGSTLMGVMAGLAIAARRPVSSAPVLLAWGAGAAAAGQLWHLVLPINKSLWTSSYALFTAGLGAIALALLHAVLDDGRSTPARDRWSEPLVAFGRNALLLFVGSGLMGRLLIVLKVGSLTLQRWIYETIFMPLAAPKVASLTFALANLALWYVLLTALHRRRWYWSA